MRSTQQQSAEEFIRKLNLVPHPRGCGYFIETDRHPIKVRINKNENEQLEKNLSTCIIAIFKGNQINPLHRTTSTQIIHYYPGGNSHLLVHIIADNGKLKTYCMPNEIFQLKISPLTWVAFEVENKNKDAFVITGHTVTPGFDMNDLELANRKTLTCKHPLLSDFISKFTLEADDSSLSCSNLSNEESDLLHDECNKCSISF